MNDRRRRILVIGIVMLVLCGAIFGLYIADARARSSANARAETVLLDSAHEQAATLSAILSGRIQVLRSIASDLELHAGSNPAAVDTYINRILGSGNFYFADIDLIDATGAQITESSFAPVNVADRAYFLKAMAGEPAMESIVGRQTGRKCVALAVPHYDADGVVCGVLRGLYYEEELRQLLISESYGGTGYSLVINSGGDTIVNAESDASELENGNLFEFLSRATFLNGDSMSKLQTAIANEQDVTIHYSFSGKTRVAALVSLNNDILPDNDWFVMNAVYGEELLGEAIATRRDAIESMSVFAIFSISALVLFLLLEADHRRKKAKDTEALRQREEQFRIMAEQSGHSVFRYDISTGTSIRSNASEDKFGIASPCPNLAETCIASGVVTPESADDYRAFFRQIVEGKSPVTGEFLMRETGGATRWYKHISTTIFDQKGRPRTAVVSYYDSTEQRERELAYAKWQQELSKAAGENAMLSEWNLTRDICDGARGDLIASLPDLSKAAFDATAAAFANTYVFHEDRSPYLSFVNREHLIGQYYDQVYDGALDYRYVANDGSLRWHRVSVQMVLYPDTQDIKLYVTDSDIDAEKREALAIIMRAEQDSLTGTLNRETFIRRTDALIAASPNGTHAILMLDVDGFKKINDLLGHNIGDEVLVDFARHIHSVLRAGDLVGRLGGDEFVVCLPDMPFDAAIEKKAQQLCSAARRQLTEQLSISVSIGVAVYPRDGADFNTLYQAADAALYHAKALGKDSFAFYRSDASRGAGSSAADISPVALPVVLIVSDSEAIGGELADMLSASYDVVQAGSISELTGILDAGRSLYAVIVDADTAFGRNALHAAGVRLRAYGMGLFALNGDTGSDTLKQLIDSDVTTVIPKPVDADLLLLCLDRLRQFKDMEQTKLQSEYHRLQTTEDLRYHEVLRATGATVFIYDVSTRTYQVDLLPEQCTAANFDGRPLSDVLLEDGVAERADIDAATVLIRQLAAGDIQHGSIRMRFLLRTGERHWYEMQARRMEHADMLTPKLLLVINDVNEQVESAAALRFRAERDALTGLYNRETFFEKAAEMIAGREPGYYVMACFDIDSFKVINDQYGTEKGDRVLQLTANLFRDRFGAAGGICCRVMADHFAVLYPASFMHTDALHTLRRDARVLDGSLPPITFSIGRYIVRDKSLSVSAMFDRAAIAEASVKGRYDTHIALYDETMREKLLRVQEISNEMNDALQKHEFEIWLQPQTNHSSGALVGCEALVRWRHSKRHAVIPPSEFIPVFEKNGFIYELDKYVWERACALLGKWLKTDSSPLPISVNVSRYDIFREDFYDVITSLVERYGIPVSLLRLEITESAFAESSEQIIEQVKRLIAYGFIVEIDDFGSGYSSLNTLKDVPANILKLDMRFLESNENSRRGGSILESVVRMAKWLGMPVIAEGVETKAQADYLASIGCYYVQGYLYSEPVPVEAFEALAAGKAKERATTRFTTIESLDNNAFWDPASMDTLIFNSYVGGACIFEYQDNQAELLRVNQKYAQALTEDGVTVEEALRLELNAHMDKDNRARLAANITRAIETGAEATCEVKLTGLPGKRGYTWLSVTVRVIARAENSLLFYGTIADVTARREADAKLVETSDQLRFLNDTARDLLTQAEAASGIESVLKKALDYFGGTRAYIYEYDGRARECVNTHEVCARGVRPAKSEYKRFSKDAVWYWHKAFQTSEFLYIEDVSALPEQRSAERDILTGLDVRASLAVSLRAGAQIIGAMGVFNPTQHLADFHNLEAIGDYMAVILTRRDLTAKIKNDNRMLTALMDDTPGGFSRMRLNADHSIVMVYCNDGFCKLIGMPHDVVMGRYGIDALWGVHPEDAPVLADILSEKWERDEARTLRYRIRHGSGDYVMLTVYIRAAKTEVGETFFNAYYTNVSESDKLDEHRHELMDSLPCAAGVYAVYDDYISVIYLNKRYEELVGRHVGYGSAASSLSTLLSGDKERLLAELAAAKAENRDMVCDIRVLHGDGGYRALRFTGKIVRQERLQALVYAIFTPVAETQTRGEA